MKLTERILQSPNGTAYANATVRVRRWSDSATIATLTTDDDGFIVWETDGHPEPYYLHLSDVPGGDKFWSGSDAMVAGALSLREVPVALRVLGDGVIRGVGSELAVSLVDGGPSVSVAPGTANVAGHPVGFYATTALSISRPESGTRTDCIVIRLNPEGSATTPGLAVLAVLPGVVDAGATALTQTATTYEMCLAMLAVPSAGAVTLTDMRTFSGEKPDAADVVQVSSATTTSAGGAALSGLSLTLTLDRAVTYDIAAQLSGRQTSTGGATGWQLQATYGPTFNGLALSSPSQVAVSPVSGKIAVADYGNARVVILSSAGAYDSGITTALTDVTGVCYDASGNLYTLGRDGSDVRLRKYDTSLALVWTTSFNTAGGQGHLTTDSTSVWLCDSVNRRVYKRTCAAGTGGTSFGGSGSTDGKFGTGGPYGITNDGTYLYVSDPSNGRIQKFTLAGVYTALWTAGSPGFVPAGCATDASGNVVVADGATVKRYTNTGTFVDTFAQSGGTGVGVASGDVLWVSNATAGTISTWDEALSAGGYGQVAIEIDSVVGTYAGIGQRDGAFSVVETGSKAGAGSVVVRAFGKATSSTMTLASTVLSARAVPRG